MLGFVIAIMEAMRCGKQVHLTFLDGETSPNSNEYELHQCFLGR